MQLHILIYKFQFLTIDGSHNDNNLVFQLLGNVIPSVEVMRDLGLIVDSNLSFDHQRLNIVKKLSRLIDKIF